MEQTYVYEFVTSFPSKKGQIITNKVTFEVTEKAVEKFTAKIKKGRSPESRFNIHATLVKGDDWSRYYDYDKEIIEEVSVHLVSVE